MRKKVDAFQVPLAEVVRYYTNMNARFLGISNVAFFVSQDPNLIRDISAYVNFYNLKKGLGLNVQLVQQVFLVDGTQSVSQNLML